MENIDQYCTTDIFSYNGILLPRVETFLYRKYIKKVFLPKTVNRLYQSKELFSIYYTKEGLPCYLLYEVNELMFYNSGKYGIMKLKKALAKKRDEYNTELRKLIKSISDTREDLCWGC